MGNPSGQPGNTKEERKVIIAEAHRNDLRRHECEAENPESSTVGVDQGKNNFEYPQKQEEEAEEEEGYWGKENSSGENLQAGWRKKTHSFADKEFLLRFLKWFYRLMKGKDR